jgi:hypothetical protein
MVTSMDRTAALWHDICMNIIRYFKCLLLVMPDGQPSGPFFDPASTSAILDDFRDNQLFTDASILTVLISSLIRIAIALF